jgi:hypothetical protein
MGYQGFLLHETLYWVYAGLELSLSIGEVGRSGGVAMNTFAGTAVRKFCVCCCWYIALIPLVNE